MAETGARQLAEIVDADGNATLGGNLVIPDGGTIGSASDTDAITIDSSGNVGIGTTPSEILDVQTSAGRFKCKALGASSVELESDSAFKLKASLNDLILDGANNVKFTISDTERMRIDSSGHVRADTFKNLAGTGAPDFPNGLTLANNAITGNITGVTLDDYEEGTWTPILSDGTNDATTNPNGWTHGSYVKIGEMIWIQGTMNTSNLGSPSISGNLRIRNLPFTASSSYIFPAFFYGAQLNLTGSYSLTGRVPDGKDYIVLSVWDSTSGVTAMQASEWGSTGYVNFSTLIFQ